MDEGAQEKVVLKLILEHLYREGDWPQLKTLHRRIYRDLKADFDVRVVAARLAPSSSSASWSLQETLMLPMGAFRDITEARPLLEALAGVIAYAVEKYKASEGDVELTQSEVEEVLHLGPREVQLLPLVLVREPFVVRGHRLTEDGWVIDISDEVVRLSNVVDVDGYLSMRDRLDAEDQHQRARMAKAHYEMIAGTLPQPEAVPEAEPPRRLHEESFVVRRRPRLASFAVAVLASLVAAGLWAWLTGFFTDEPGALPSGQSDPNIRADPSPSALSGHPLAAYSLTLEEVQEADRRGSGWTDVTNEQVSSFAKDEPCGRAPRPLPALETAVAYQRGSSQFVIEAIGRFPGVKAESYFDHLREVTASCSSWHAEEFGTKVTKTIEHLRDPHVGDESLRMLLTTTTGPGFPVYRIDNIYFRRDDIVVNLGQVVSIASPDEDLTMKLVRVVAAKM